MFGILQFRTLLFGRYRSIRNVLVKVGKNTQFIFEDGKPKLDDKSKRELLIKKGGI